METELHKVIRQAIAEDPERIPEVTSAINEGLAAFIATQKMKRDEVAGLAVLSLMGLANVKGRPLSRLIDAAFHQFPSGPHGHAPAELKFWGHFLDAARRDDIDRAWLGTCKGRDYVEWWDRHVAPAITSA